MSHFSKIHDLMYISSHHEKIQDPKKNSSNRIKINN